MSSSVPQRRAITLLAIALASAPLACHRDAPSPSGAAASSSAAAASAATSSASASDPAPTAPLAPIEVPTEARRMRLARLDEDPDLAANARAIRAHFGEVPSPLFVQVAELDGGRYAWLLDRGGDDPAPFLLVLDGEGEVVFTKDRPLAGIVPGIRELAIAPASDGALSLVWFDTPSHTIAVRTWQADGTVLADHVLLEIESCDALSALHWPGHGLVVVASQRGGARAQRLGEDGLVAWGRDGIAVPASWRAAAPVSLAWSGDALYLVHHGHARGAAGAGAADHLVAERYDAAGAPLWPRPLDLGPVARVADPKARIPIEPIEGGALRVALGARVGPRTITVMPDGTAVRR